MRWVASQPLATLFTLTLACAEIRAGISFMADPGRKIALEEWLMRKVRPFFGSRILEADEETWLSTLAVLKRNKAARRTMPTVDLLFAAAADRHGMVLVTRNVRDFVGTGIPILNPWLESPAVETP